MPNHANPIIQAAEERSAQKTNSAKAVPGSQTSVPLKAGESASSSTTKSITVRGPSQIDNLSATNFSSTIDAIDTGLTKARIATNQLQKSASSESSLTDAVASTIANTTASKQVISMQQGQAQMQAEKDTDRIFDAMGGVDRLAKLAINRKAAVNNLIAKKQEIVDNENIDVATDGVLAFIGSKFLTKELNKEKNAAQDLVNTFDSAISNINSLASATDQTLERMKRTVTDATLEAQSNVLAEKATMDAAQYKIASVKSNAEKVRLGMSMSKQEVSAQIQKWQLGLQERSFKDSQADRDLRRKGMAKDERFRENLVNGILEGRKKMGVPTYQGTDPELITKEREEIFTQFQLKGERAQKLATQFDVGTGVLPPTPFQTFSAVAATDPNRFSNESNKALTVISDAMVEVQEASRGTASSPKFKLTAQNAPGLVNEAFKVKMEAFETQIRSTDEENPNKAAPLAGLIAAYPNLQAEPLVKDVLMPLLNADVKDLDAELVFETAFAAVKTKRNPEGVLSFEDAVEGIAYLYSTAILENNNSQDREGLGIPLQTTYNAKFAGRLNINKIAGDVISAIAPRGFKRTVNLVSESEIRAAAVKLLSARGENDLQALGLDQFGTTNRRNRTQEN